MNLENLNTLLTLKINHYAKDILQPSRQLSFCITEECLKDYLACYDDERTIGEFLESYDSDESQVIYEYATDDGRIISEEISYCDDFIDQYEEYIDNLSDDESIMKKEMYYWDVYA